MEDNFLLWAKKHKLVKPVAEAFINNNPEEEWHKGEVSYLIEEETTDYDINIGDIVFVENFEYKSKGRGKNHLFVIVEEDNTVVALEYFGMLISSKLSKLRYKQNILLRKDDENRLHKDSIVKTDYLYKITPDMISFKLGTVTKEQVQIFKECMITNYESKDKIENYITTESNIIEKEFKLLEEISKLRIEHNLTQRQLANILNMKQPMLAKIEKSKNSPQLNTLLKILDSLGYTIEFVEKKKG